MPLALLAQGSPATAEESGAAANAQPTTAETGDVAKVSDAFSQKWGFQLGAGALNGPRYPGSRYDFTRGLPVVAISYDRYFIGGGPGSGAPAGLGAYLLRSEHWAVGLNVGGDTRKPRRASDDPILRGWGDISSTARGGLFASYTLDWLSVHGSVSAAGHHEGILATLGIEAKYRPIPGLTLSIGPAVTWANSQYAMTYFGVNSAQSEIAGIAPYRAQSGINSVGGSANLSCKLTAHWLLAAHVSYGWLQGDAADSPVTTDKTQRVYGAFVMYGF